jgi:hypothetical protein
VDGFVKCGIYKNIKRRHGTVPAKPTGMDGYFLVVKMVAKQKLLVETELLREGLVHYTGWARSLRTPTNTLP